MCRCSIQVRARPRTTFVQKGIGDADPAWENEAHLEVEEAKGRIGDHQAAGQPFVLNLR